MHFSKSIGQNIVIRSISFVFHSKILFNLSKNKNFCILSRPGYNNNNNKHLVNDDQAQAASYLFSMLDVYLSLKPFLNETSKTISVPFVLPVLSLLRLLMVITSQFSDTATWSSLHGGFFPQRHIYRLRIKRSRTLLTHLK